MDYNRLKLTKAEKQRIINDLEQEKDNLIWALLGASEQINNEIRLLKGLPTRITSHVRLTRHSKH